MPEPKILTIDIETSPSLAYVWRLFKENIPLQRLVDSGEVLSFAAKWYGQEDVMFYSTFHNGKEQMVDAAHILLSEADVVVHYNGKKFDIPHLNREFLLAMKTPPSPYAQVDLYHTVRKNFNFVSNKLDHVAQELKIGAKVEHAGFQLWVDCMKSVPEAWEDMKTYNMQDVVLTEKLYDVLLPWLSGNPHLGLYTNKDENSCPNCGSKELRPQGRAYTSVSVFQRYRCANCGKWSRGNKRLESVDIQSAKL